MLQYAAKLTPGLPEEGGYTVTFRDVPEAITDGETLEDRLARVAVLDLSTATRVLA